MDAAYENALRTIADCYESEAGTHEGKSLARVATIVINNGAFFVRLREGKPFLVHTLERFATWFRAPNNWPAGTIPHQAAHALASIGRPPLTALVPHSCRTDDAVVTDDRRAFSPRTVRA